MHPYIQVRCKTKTNHTNAMRNTFGLLFLLTTLLSCSSKSTKTNTLNESETENTNSKFNWVTYRDTVNVGFIMTFKYPDNLVAESIENGRCVGEPIKTDSTADSDVTNTMKWCIWMNDTAESESIDSLISSEKYFFKGRVTEQRDSLVVNDIKALRVNFKSDNKNDPYRQMIYFKKYSTLFEIINNYGADKDFEIFYNSLTIDATEKKPSH